MKQYLILILSLFIVSCAHLKEGEIISEISNPNNKSRPDLVKYVTYYGHTFWARIDLYAIGDTVKFAR